MRHPLDCLLLCLAISTASFAATGRPATLPAGAVVLGDNLAWFLPPEGWKLTEKGTGNKSYTYGSGDGASILIDIAPSPPALPTTPEVRQKMARLMIDALKLRLKQLKAEVIVEPQLEDDPRFAMRVHNAFKAEGSTFDQVHLYHPLGRALLRVTITAAGEDAPRIKAVQSIGENLLASVRSTSDDVKVTAQTRPAPLPAGLSDKPIVFPKAKARLYGPRNWRCQEEDRTDGNIATFREYGQPQHFIMVAIYQIPDDVRNDPAARNKCVESMVAGSQQQFKLDNVEVAGKPEVVADGRFLRKTRTTYEGKTAKFESSGRHIVVGDGVLAVYTLGQAAEGNALAELGDKIALAAKPK